MSLLREWTQGFCPLNTIERALSDLIDARGSNTVERVSTALTAQDAMEMLEPGDILVDCTGCKSLLRDHLEPYSGAGVDGANTVSFRLEYAIVATFLFGGPYVCNEFCKYYKNVENLAYKFIPAVDRTCYDGDVSHVTGIVVISAEEYAEMPARFDGQWLRGHFPDVATSMDRFIDKIRQEAQGDVVGDLEIVRIPLILYRARNATSRKWRNAARGDHPFAEHAGVPARRLGHRLALLPVDLAGLRVRHVPGGPHRPARASAAGTCSTATSCTSTSSGCASTCAAR